MPTRYQEGEPDVQRALSAYINLMRASESVTARLARRLDSQGLTTSQLGVLEALRHLGPLCQAELGRKILKSGGNITMVVDNLEKRELVRRVRDEKDRRYVSVHLTPAGKRLINKLFPGHAEEVRRQMSALSAAELEQLRALCRKLGRGDEKENENESADAGGGKA